MISIQIIYRYIIGYGGHMFYYVIDQCVSTECECITWLVLINKSGGWIFANMLLATDSAESGVCSCMKVCQCGLLKILKIF